MQTSILATNLFGKGPAILRIPARLTSFAQLTSQFLRSPTFVSIDMLSVDGRVEECAQPHATTANFEPGKTHKTFFDTLLSQSVELLR